MRTFLVAAATAAVSLTLVSGLSRAADDKKPKYTVKEVMKQAHGKDGILKKVTGGSASKDDKDKLVEMYTALGENKPNKGEEKSWKEKCESLVEAAKAAQKDDKDAKSKLEKASNCMACHSVHK